MRALPIVLLCSLGLFGCDSDNISNKKTTTDHLIEFSTTVNADAESISSQIWQQIQSTIKQNIEAATRLKQQVEQLVLTPNQNTLNSSRQQWHLAHNRFQQAMALFSLGKINPSLFPQLQTSFANLDSQPIQPGYLDYFDVYTHSGIVNDLTLDISAANIRSQHELTDVTDVSLGFHAIEYLLWGETGQRPVTDFQKKTQLNQQQRQNGMRLIDLPSQRRNSLLQLQTQLLIDDLNALHNKLAQQNSGLQNTYESVPALSRIQLWQQAITTTLQDIASSPLLSALTPATSESTLHNNFAGANLSRIAATLIGIEQLVVIQDAELNTILNWLTEEDALTFTQQLNATTVELDSLIKQGLALSTEQKAAIKSQLQLLAALMSNQ
jgi:putative iron-regulated protein